MNKNYGSVIAICVIVVLTTFAGIINESLKPSRGSPNFSAFVVYNPYVEGLENHNPKKHWSQFLADLALIKDLGFQGVKLHDVWKFWNDSILVDAVRAMKTKGLDVIIQLIYFNPEQFPQNDTHTTLKLSTMKSIASQLKDETNVLWYALCYPYKWELRHTYIKNLTDPRYKTELQRMVDGIRESDLNHPIYLVSDNIEYWVGTPPYDINNIAGYGYMLYNRIPDDIQYEEQNYGYYKYFRDIAVPRGLNVYIDEWGIQTNNPTQFGKASDETMKCQMIKDFVNYCILGT